jgi:hypothetical protein
VLSDPKKRKAYDAGEDITTLQPFGIAEEITRFYFPEKRGLNVSCEGVLEVLEVLVYRCMSAWVYESPHMLGGSAVASILPFNVASILPFNVRSRLSLLSRFSSPPQPFGDPHERRNERREQRERMLEHQRQRNEEMRAREELIEQQKQQKLLEQEDDEEDEGEL